MKVLHLIAAAGMMLASLATYAQYGPQPILPSEATCTSIAQLGAWGESTCTWAQGTKYSKEGVENLPGTMADGNPVSSYTYKTMSVAPWTGTGLRVKHYFDGFGALCTPPRNSAVEATGYITIKHVQDHCPYLQGGGSVWAVGQQGGTSPLGWGGPSYGFGTNDTQALNVGWRVAGSTTKAFEAYTGRTDVLAGIRYEGGSYGGTTGILQSMLNQDPWWRALTTIVNVNVPHTLFTAKGPLPGNLPDNGHYWSGTPNGSLHTIPLAVSLAWKTYNPELVNLLGTNSTSLADQLKGVYFRAVGDPTTDNLVKFDIRFFAEWCNNNKIACYGNWHHGGHASYEPFSNAPSFGPIQTAPACNHQLNPPANCVPDPAFSGPDSDVRLDRMLPVFTNSTGNHLNAVRGHYNMGLEWHSNVFNVDTESLVLIPIRYRARSNFGTGAKWCPSPTCTPAQFIPDTENAIPNQPTDITVSLTLRRVSKFALPQGRRVKWTMNAQNGLPLQTGYVIVQKTGEVTVDNLQMRSSTAYAGFVLEPDTPPVPDWKIVYTRQPFNGAPIPGNPYPDSELSNFQFATDVGRINWGMDEADVVIDDLAGNKKVIFNCTGDPAVNCVAQEARVSPDKTKIAFSVGYSAPGPAGITLGTTNNDLAALTCAQLFIYTIASDRVDPVPGHPQGGCTAPYNSTPKAIDRQPDWLNNNTLVFVSNRGNYWPARQQNNQSKINGNTVSQIYGYGNDGKAMQLHTVNVSNGTTRNIGMHDLMALAPTVTTSGDILYSCYNAHAMKAIGPGTNGPIAEANFYWLCRTDYNGADMTVLLHGHRQDQLRSKNWLPTYPGTSGGLVSGYIAADGSTQGIGGTTGSEEIRGLRNVAEIFKGKLAISTYYRSNHKGSNGIVWSFDAGVPHVEGCLRENCLDFPHNSLAPSSAAGSGFFLPKSMKAITPWGQAGDAMPGFAHNPGGSICHNQTGAAKPNPSPIPCRSYGKAGYAAPWDANSFLITHARGQCYDGWFDPIQLTRSWLGGEPVCRKRIMRVFATNGQNAVMPSTTSPFDTNQMVPLVEDANFQIFDGRPINTYQNIYGQSAPATKAALNPNAGCFLQVVNAKESELYMRTTTAGHPQQRDGSRCIHQGCAVQPNNENANYIRDNMTFFSVRSPVLWNISYQGNVGTYTNTMNTHGHRDMKFYQRTRLKSDGSVKMRVPCETPLVMSGENAAGEIIAHDDVVHSLRAGETRTCHGCHDGHSTERYAELGNVTAVSRFATTLAAADNPPLSTLRELPKFNRVQLILTARCGSCHTGFENDLNLYSRVVWDIGQVEFQPWMTRRTNPPQAGTDPERIYGLWRPLTSRLVSKFALESPLYWYASGRRTDGRRNDSRDWDIDYYAGHPATGVTAVERGVLRDWLDSGAPFQ